MHPRLAAVASAQHGVFTRAQAITSGFSAGQVDHRLRSKRWLRVLPRVYREVHSPASDEVARWAAVLWAGPDAALSHTTAAVMWGLPVVAFGTELVVSRRRALARVPGVLVHRPQHLRPGDVERLDGLPVTSPLRTLIDLSAVLGDADFEAALEGARGRGLVTARASATRRLFRSAARRLR